MNSGFSNIWQILVMPPHEILSIIQLTDIAIHMMANNWSNANVYGVA